MSEEMLVATKRTVLLRPLRIGSGLCCSDQVCGPGPTMEWTSSVAKPRSTWKNWSIADSCG